MSDAAAVAIRSARWPDDRAEVAALFRAYETSLTGTLPAILCFQGFEQELATLPGKYAPPAGEVLLARGPAAALGVVALRPIEDGFCEMKRLYVAPEARSAGLGRRLAESVIQTARRLGYPAMRLDTHVSMGAGIALYRKLGFREIPAYGGCPVDGLLYFERAL